MGTLDRMQVHYTILSEFRKRKHTNNYAYAWVHVMHVMHVMHVWHVTHVLHVFGLCVQK